MKKIAFTIVLNGMPFIKKQHEVIPNVFDEWHIIEGATLPTKDTGWCKPINNEHYNNTEGDYFGCSIDGTSEFLDSIKNDKIFVHRKGQLWEGKTEMCKVIEPSMENCILMQFDVDEIWTIDVLKNMLPFIENEDVDGALFHCNYYVGPNLKIINENCYGNYMIDWCRLWKIKEKSEWVSHEPARVKNLHKFFNRNFTKEKGWIFDHYAYVLEEQVRFKENFYGYTSALDCWKTLQNHNKFPCNLRDFLPWVKDDAIVDIV